jgi:uncharacterized protein (TIGR02391 family)
MAKKEAKNFPHTDVSALALPSAIRTLERRLREISDMPSPRDDGGIASAISAIVTKVNAAYESIFGSASAQAEDGRIEANDFYGFYATTHSDRLEAFERQRKKVLAKLNANLELLQERLADSAESEGFSPLHAYKSLDLHSEISRATNSLYETGHYANAIEDAVKALNALVRLRSGVDDLDGVKLMTTVFSPEKPALKFNALADVSDKDEQRGFMMMFAGAVAGLRNPRAHKLIQDDPERALEFIAFVSLLAKLLDGAKKR